MVRSLTSKHFEIDCLWISKHLVILYLHIDGISILGQLLRDFNPMVIGRENDEVIDLQSDKNKREMLMRCKLGQDAHQSQCAT